MPTTLQPPQVNMHDAKTMLSQLVKELEDGSQESFIIARHGKPVAQLSLYKPRNAKPKTRIGAAKGKLPVPDDAVLFNDDITELFEEYL